MHLLPPLRFRFHAEDHERYGDQWHVYDESVLSRVPVRELIAIEAIIGMSLDTMRRRLREGYADANLAATWLVRRQSGLVEDYDTYEPLITFVEWQPAGDAVPPVQDSDSSQDPSQDPSMSSNQSSPSRRTSRRVS